MMTADQFSRLLNYMDERFDSIHAQFALKADKLDLIAVGGRLDRLEKLMDSSINAIDGLYDRFDSLHLEYSATTSHQRRIQSQLNQHNTRITKLESA